MCWDSTTELEENVAKLDDVRQQIKAVERMLALPETKNKSHLRVVLQNDLAGLITRAGALESAVRRISTANTVSSIRDSDEVRSTAEEDARTKGEAEELRKLVKASAGRFAREKEIDAQVFTSVAAASNTLIDDERQLTPIAELHDDAVTTKETKETEEETPLIVANPPGRREEFVELA